MKYLTAIGVLIAIVLWIFFFARSDYNRADLIIEQEVAKDWTIVVKLKNVSDLTLPWTWFKTPVTGL
jgi:hypothetical protein